MKPIVKGNWGGRSRGCGGYSNVSGTSSDRVNTDTLSNEKKPRKRKLVESKMGWNNFKDYMNNLRRKKVEKENNWFKK